MMSKIQILVIVSVLVLVLVLYSSNSTDSSTDTYFRVPKAPTASKEPPTEPSWDGKHLADDGSFMYGAGGDESYGYKASAREMYPGNASSVVIPDESTPQTAADWIQSTASQRARSAPQISKHSQFIAPVVSALDPHDYEENPLDPFLDDILMQVPTYKNRNANLDARGQPHVDPNFLEGSDQLIPVRNTERLAYHGKSHQITGCTTQEYPRY